MNVQYDGVPAKLIELRAAGVSMRSAAQGGGAVRAQVL